MAIYGESLTIQYIAWDTVNNVPKTGDASNHTLRWVKDGTAAAPTNSPSEVDATNAPGVYKLTLTASETQCWVGTLCGKSSTSGVVIMPVTLTFERLPTAAPGSSGGLPVIGSAPLTNLDAAISSRSTLTAADVWSYASRTLSGFAFQVTVGGYTTGQSPSEQLQSLGYSSSRAAKLDNLDAAVSSRLAASSYIAPDNASISAIKTQTDKFQFDSNNYVYAVGIGGGGGVQVVVQPLVANVQRTDGDGGVITLWQHARIRASWHLNANLESHDLRLIIFSPDNPSMQVCECSGNEVSVTLQSDGSSVVAVNAADTKMPSPGIYSYILRDQTTDAVLIAGRCIVKGAPDASS